jgi:hypothetical protein
MFKYRNFNQTNSVENVFGIDNNSKLQYIVGKYQSSLARLEITTATTQGFVLTHKLVFSGVLYMQLCRQWANSHFALASPSQCIQLVRQFTELNQLSDEAILNHYALYTAAISKSVEVLVLCTNSRISEVTE